MTDQAAQLEARPGTRSDVAWLYSDRPVDRAPRLDRTWVTARAVSDVLLLTFAMLLSGVANGDALGAWSVFAFSLTLAGFVSAGLYQPRLRLRLFDELR